MTKTFEQHLAYFESNWGEVRQWDDVKALLEWIRDKPGQEVGLGEFAGVFGETEKDKAYRRLLSAVVILTAGPEPIGEAFFKVRSKDGNLYPVGEVPNEVMEGNELFVLPATGETVEDFGSRAYYYLRFAEFEPAPAPPTQP